MVKIMKTKMIVFDMDGVLAGLYNVNGWLEDLHNENTRPYDIAEPLVDMITLNNILINLKAYGYRIAVVSWLAKDATKKYDDMVRIAKRNWLNKFDFPYDEIHLVKYGTTKANAVRKKTDYAILIDDNANIRKGWTLGETIDGTTDFLENLKNLMDKSDL